MYFSEMNTRIRIQELMNYSEIKKMQNKGHMKISESTVACSCKFYTLCKTLIILQKNTKVIVDKLEKNGGL